jgi:hypothetical protein
VNAIQRESGDQAGPDSVSFVEVRRRGFDRPSGATIQRSAALFAGS